MGSRTQDVPGYYVWHGSGKPVEVHLQLDVLDRLASEIMRGFGAVPKRGAEVGGLLLGTIQPGSPAIVRIEDFEPVPCHYRRGPSYLFTEDDSAAFEQAASGAGSLIPSPIGLCRGLLPRSHPRRPLARPGRRRACWINSFPAPPTSRSWLSPTEPKSASVDSFFARMACFPQPLRWSFPSAATN